MFASSKNSESIIIGGGWKIKLTEKSYRDTIKQICQSIDDLEKKYSTISLKSAPDRKVFLITAKAEPLLIKNHIHNRFGSRLKASLRTTYLLREFENTKIANQLAVPSSRMLGYGCRVSKGLICQELLLSIGSPETTPLIESLREHAKNEEEIVITLQRTFNLISRMLKAGYVHLDMHSDNILISASGPDKDVIIDHEFGSLFSEDKMVEVAAFVFGYLFRCQVREHISFEKYAAIVNQTITSHVVGQVQLNPRFEDLFHFAATQRIPKKNRHKYLRL